MTRCIAFVQARMSSSRLPGKVLAPIDGRPAIVHLVDRARQARLLDDVVVVTSTDASDDPLADALRMAGVPAFRGDLNDVLSRYVAAARAHPCDEVVRLTGDCPLVDPSVVDAVVALRRSTGADYASNVDPPTFPDGLDCECFTTAVLERAHALASPGPAREHVTLWMRGEAAGLARANHRCIVDASHLRLTVDYPDDLEAVRRIVALTGPGASPGLFDVLRILDVHRDILLMNPHARNEGLARSLGQLPAEPSPPITAHGAPR